MPTLSNLDKESWKYSNINAALKKLEVSPRECTWHMPTAFTFLEGDHHLVISRNRKVDHPLEISLVAHAGSHISAPLHIHLESGAEATIIEHQSGEDAYWKNTNLVITLAENAQLRHYRISDDGPASVVTDHLSVVLSHDARYHMVAINGAAGFARSDIHVKLMGKGAACDLSGLTLLDGKRHSDTTLCVDHIAPHCQSSQFFKNALKGQSRGVYQGKIHVHKDAQKTDGYQLSNNLLLSPLAEMDVKPELEIYADDVKCSHGTTTGQLDETPVFYLMSRGIDPDSARRLLLEAFLSDVLDKIPDETVRATFDKRVATWLG